MHRTPATLQRFAAALPGLPMPDRMDELPLTAQLRLKDADPELAMLLSGEAPAALEAAVLGGQFPAICPSFEMRADVERQQQIEALLAACGGNPYGKRSQRGEDGRVIPAVPANLTLALQLERLDPQLAEELRLEACPPIPSPGALTVEGAAHVAAAMGRVG